MKTYSTDFPAHYSVMGSIAVYNQPTNDHSIMEYDQNYF